MNVLLLFLGCGVIELSYPCDDPWYRDNDGDGYAPDDTDDVAAGCEAPEGYVYDRGDCDDTDPTLNPATAWRVDADGDGYGGDDLVQACLKPEGTVAIGPSGDCDDSRALTHPSADEYCNGVDDDCNGAVDDGAAVDGVVMYQDGDIDGWGGDSTELRCLGVSTS